MKERLFRQSAGAVSLVYKHMCFLAHRTRECILYGCLKQKKEEGNDSVPADSPFCHENSGY